MPNPIIQSIVEKRKLRTIPFQKFLSQNLKAIVHLNELLEVAANIIVTAARKGGNRFSADWTEIVWVIASTSASQDTIQRA